MFLVGRFGTLQLVDELRPSEVIVSDEVLVGSFAGSAAGQGLDLQGDFAYAINIRGPATMDDGSALVAGDATFTTDITAGFEISATLELLSWASPFFGDSTGDRALAVLMRSIRYTHFPTPVSLSFGNLEAGTHYKLQVSTPTRHTSISFLPSCG